MYVLVPSPCLGLGSVDEGFGIEGSSPSHKRVRSPSPKGGGADNADIAIPLARSAGLSALTGLDKPRPEFTSLHELDKHRQVTFSDKHRLPKSQARL